MATPEKKKTNLQQHLELVLATLDYLLDKFAGSLVSDGDDPVKDFYEQQKLQAIKYYKGRRLDKLQAQLKRFTDRFRDMHDLTFFSYFKEKTGVELNFIADLQAHIGRIIERGKLESQDDVEAVFAQFTLWKQTTNDPEKEALLRAMLGKHAAQYRGVSKKTSYSEVISREIVDGEEVVTVRVHSGPKLTNFEQQVIKSPDGKRSVYVNQYSPDGRYPTTSVNISFPTSSGGIYQTRGLHPGVKAYWKNNNTVVIETPKGLNADLQYHTLRSFDDTITVEYIVTEGEEGQQATAFCCNSG